jgi:hypothetical protein
VSRRQEDSSHGEDTGKTDCDTHGVARAPKVAGTVTRKLPLPKPRPQKPMPRRTGKK